MEADVYAWRYALRVLVVHVRKEEEDRRRDKRVTITAVLTAVFQVSVGYITLHYIYIRNYLKWPK